MSEESGDLVIDAGVRDLEAADEHGLDHVLEAAESLHRTLQARLSDLGE